MFLSGLMIGMAVGLGIAIAGSCLFAAVVMAGRADAAAAGLMTDEFTPSMNRFGYVQDARNRGDL